MKLHKKIKKIFVLFFVSFLLLGCGNANPTETITPQNKLESQDLSITEYCTPLSRYMFLLKDGAVFVGNNETTEEQSKQAQEEEVYGTSYQLYYEEFDTGETAPGGSVRELFELNNCYLQGMDVRFNENQEWTIVVLLICEDGYYIEEYSQDGKVQNMLSCDEILSKDEYTTKIKAISNDEYQLWTEKMAYHITKDGDYEQIVNGESEENTIVDLDAYGIPAQTIYGIYTENEEIKLLQYYVNGDSERVRLLKIPAKLGVDQGQEQQAQSEKYTEAGKRIVTIYCPYGDVGKYLLSTAIIDGFNLENDDYCVVIEEGSPEKKHTDLVKENGPDLLLEQVNSCLSDYEENGYLENLGPFLLERGLFEDLSQEVLNIYCNDNGEIYSLPNSLFFFSIAIPESEANGRENWTVDEFLQWASLHRNLHTSKQELLNLILLGNMEQYIDTSSACAYFEGDAFKELLVEIRDLPFPIEYSESDILERQYVGESDWVNTYFYTTGDVAKYEKIMGEPIVFMGLPNDNRQPVSPCEYMTTLSLLKNSSCKEGALEFMEYYLKYPKLAVSKAEKDGEQTEGKLCVLNSIKEKELQLSLGERSVVLPSENGGSIEIEYEITPGHINKFNSAALQIRKDDEISVAARQIVQEEVQAYFQGAKSVEQVCKIIQGRVSVMLEEVMVLNER